MSIVIVCLLMGLGAPSEYPRPELLADAGPANPIANGAAAIHPVSAATPILARSFIIPP